MTRFSSFVLLVTLAGTPAAGAVCVAMCLEGAFHHAMSAPAAGHGHHDSAPVDASHEHDESDEALAAADAAWTDDTSSIPLRVSASKHDCCPTADAIIQARYPGQRTDVRTALSISAVALARATSIPSFVSLRPPPDFDPPDRYSPRSQAPLVLRI